MSFANAWGSYWGSSGTGTSETIIVDSYGLDISMEEAIFENTTEFVIEMDMAEISLEQEDQVLSVEDSSFVLEMEE